MSRSSARPLAKLAITVLVMTTAMIAGHPDRAHAEASAPFVTPAQDTDIRYEVTNPVGAAMHQRMRWQVANLRQRLEPGDSEGADQTPTAYVVTNYKTGQAAMVDPAHHVVLDGAVPLEDFAPPGTPAKGNWKKGGPEVIAGLACTDWSGRDLNGQETAFCYTPDGVLLGSSRDGKPLVRALSVRHEAVPDAVFIIPAGFRHVSQPRGAAP